MPSIRELIDRALREAQEEFAAIVQRKLSELMGDADTAAPARARKPAAAPKPARKGARARVPADHMATLRERVLSGMRPGEAMKKSQIMSAARLGDDEAQRVGLVLKRLKDEGVLAMRGQKGAATYSLKGARRRDESGESSEG
jgi:hypothetical protein